MLARPVRDGRVTVVAMLRWGPSDALCRSACYEPPAVTWRAIGILCALAVLSEGCGWFLGDLDISLARDGGAESDAFDPTNQTCADGWQGDVSSDPNHCGDCFETCDQ
jgi:hypothetical protein